MLEIFHDCKVKLQLLSNPDYAYGNLQVGCNFLHKRVFNSLSVKSENTSQVDHFTFFKLFYLMFCLLISYLLLFSLMFNQLFWVPSVLFLPYPTQQLARGQMSFSNIEFVELTNENYIVFSFLLHKILPFFL